MAGRAEKKNNRGVSLNSENWAADASSIFRQQKKKFVKILNAKVEKKVCTNERNRVKKKLRKVCLFTNATYALTRKQILYLKTVRIVVRERE